MSDDRVIVIGSGPCGAMAADRLVAGGLAVTMLDSGLHAPRGAVVRAAGNTLFRAVDRRQLESDRLAPVAGEDVDWFSSRSHGGLSNYWTGAVPRFAPDDFTEGGRIDESYVWPITYDDLVPYYEMAEDKVVVTAGGGFANVPANVSRYTTTLPTDWAELARASSAAGHCVGAIPLAKGSPWMAAGRGTEFSSYHCVIKPLLQSPLFELISGAHATSLDYSASTGRVESVRYVDRETRQVHTIRGRAVVVAAGAIDTTVLLLRSTSSDFPAGLGNTAGLVGQYLHDHPRQWWVAEPAQRMSALAHPVYISRQPLGKGAPLMATSLTLGLARSADRLRTYGRGKVGSFGVQVFGTMVPRPEVGVSLVGSPDVSDPDVRPRLSLAYDQAALDNVSAARQRLEAVFHDAGETVRIPGPFHELTPGSSVHFGGSVRMHQSPQHGAIDGYNRLHDVPNVAVVDSSCFTTGPEKNPTLTAMAIAARAADRFVEELTG